MPSENFDRRGRAQTKQRDRSIRDRNCFIFRVQSIRVALPPSSPPPGSNGSPTKKTMRIEKRWFHVTIVHERSNDYPLFHIVRNRRTLDWLHFDEKSTRPILITTVIRVAFRPWWWKAELIRLDACFAWRIAAGIRRLLILWRKRGGFEWNCVRIYTKFLYDQDSMMSSYFEFIMKINEN